MTTGNRRWLTSFANACAVAIAIVIGITAGYIVTAGEELEEKLRGGKRGLAKQSRHML